MNPQEIALTAAPGFPYLSGRSVSEEVVIEAVSRIEQASALPELQTLAYAFYLGILDADEFLRRLGTSNAVLRTMHAFLGDLPSVDGGRVAEQLPHGVAGYHGRAVASSKEEGWAFTLFDALYESGYEEWLKLFVQDDPARIGIRWATQGVLAEADASRVVAAWAALGDALHISAAGFLVLASIESEIDGREPMIDISVLGDLPRAIIAGQVMGNLLRRGRNPNELKESAHKRELLVGRLSPAIPSWIQTPSDVRKFVHGSKVRNEEELVAFLLTLPLQPRISRAAKDEGDALLRRAFRRVSTRAELDGGQLMYVAGWMISPLANTALSIRMGPELFEEFLDNLAFDEYAHDFDYPLYLNDRVRAILLCAIGAVVAKKCDEKDLFQLAGKAADLIRCLPAGSVAVFGDEVLSQLRNDFAITLPRQ